MNLAPFCRHGKAVFAWCAETLPVSVGKTAGRLLTISRDQCCVQEGAAAASSFDSYELFAVTRSKLKGHERER
jgi:hypothetical protein